jgi:hypothetical protein
MAWLHNDNKLNGSISDPCSVTRQHLRSYASHHDHGLKTLISDDVACSATAALNASQDRDRAYLILR